MYTDRGTIIKVPRTYNVQQRTKFTYNVHNQNILEIDF